MKKYFVYCLYYMSYLTNFVYFKTIWDITLKYKSDKLDLRDMIAEIRDFNNLEYLSIKLGDIIRFYLIKDCF